MQQWEDLPQEVTGRRKSAKNAAESDFGMCSELLGDETVCDDDQSSLFCEACRKWFKSEQQM
jgi:hypothetical protein